MFSFFLFFLFSYYHFCIACRIMWIGLWKLLMKRFGTVTSLINVQFLVFSLKISFGPAVTRTLAPVPSFALFQPGGLHLRALQRHNFSSLCLPLHSCLLFFQSSKGSWVPKGSKFQGSAFHLLGFRGDSRWCKQKKKVLIYGSIVFCENFHPLPSTFCLLYIYIFLTLAL